MGQATICALLRPNSTHKRIFTKSVRMYVRTTTTYIQLRTYARMYVYDVPTQLFPPCFPDRMKIAKMCSMLGEHTRRVRNNKPAETDARTGTRTKLAEAKAHS